VREHRGGVVEVDLLARRLTFVGPLGQDRDHLPRQE
jgi:hypothetical protein